MTADAAAASTRINPGRLPRVGRVKGLLAGPHGPSSQIFHALAEGSPDVEYYFEDFQWATITGSAGPFTSGSQHAWAYAESNAGATDPAKVTPTEALTSAMLLTTTANTYNQTMLGPKKYTANTYAYFEVRMQVSQITDFALTIGFADAIPASAASVVSDIDTPAVTTVADGAFYAIDTSQTLKTAALVAVGTSTAVNATTIAATGAPFGIPTAATFFTVRVQLEGNKQTSGVSRVMLFINDALVAETANGPDSEKLMSPFIFAGSPGGTAVATTYDYFRCYQQKAGSPL